MAWIFYAAIAAGSMAAADGFVKLAANKISSSLGLLVYGCCTFLTGLEWTCGTIFSWGAAASAPRENYANL